MSSGTPKGDIRFGQSSLYVKKTLHGKVVNGSYIPHTIEQIDSSKVIPTSQGSPEKRLCLPPMKPTTILSI